MVGRPLWDHRPSGKPELRKDRSRHQSQVFVLVVHINTSPGLVGWRIVLAVECNKCPMLGYSRHNSLRFLKPIPASEDLLKV
ncbi:hypothetical protein RRG08_051199 [Elysia crispata]|uniref:Uncharacterized protein n=1 Tax=Elysia crispata TaxID=231223 RepID=A0AAE1DBT4_9GAST|nr:hypothetical protein RRG08_051199 [Elysia crispata]